MKKFIIFLLVLILPLTLISCNENKSNDNTQLETDDTDLTEKDLSSLFSSCAKQNYFYSVKDLETYLSTGSTAPEDYIQVPDFEYFSSVSGYKTNEYIKQGYISLKDVFGINIDETDSFNSLSYSLLDSGSICFDYFFDTNNYINVEYNPKYFSKMTTTDYFVAYSNYSGRPYVATNYEKSSNTTSKYAYRQVGEDEVVYTYKEGIPTSVAMIIGDYYIRISSAGGFSEPDEAKKAYDEFMQSEEFAPLAAFFSEDDEVFAEAVQKTKSIALNDKTNSAS